MCVFVCLVTHTHRDKLRDREKDRVRVRVREREREMFSSHISSFMSRFKVCVIRISSTIGMEC